MAKERVLPGRTVRYQADERNAVGPPRQSIPSNAASIGDFPTLPQQDLDRPCGLLIDSFLQQDFPVSEVGDEQQRLADARTTGRLVWVSRTSFTASSITPNSQVASSRFGLCPLRTAQAARSTAV
jgi:hypothetical protein